MTDTTLRQNSPTTNTEYEAEFDRLLQEMTLLDTRMQSDRRDIERFRAESLVITGRTDAMLDQLELQLDRLRRKG